ncbi:nucleoside deaminase [Acinetobacter sp. WZC-1]|uniref:nucleoside deaminase n=1 Tax=Acinetobacter sp. WZC-1 TaxID=3459034 RepID=UPI00403E2622
MADMDYIQQAIQLAEQNVQSGGRPFGAVIVKNDAVISRGVNQILQTNDPTAHAELQAVREACHVLQSISLKGCTVYASGQPCPMCLAAMRMTGIERIVYAYSNQDAEPFGLSTENIAIQLRAEPRQQQGLEFIQLKPGPEPELYVLWAGKQS